MRGTDGAWTEINRQESSAGGGARYPSPSINDPAEVEATILSHLIPARICVAKARPPLEPGQARDMGCVPWDAFGAAVEDVGPVDEDGRTAWEREVLDKFEVIDASTTTASDITPGQSFAQSSA